MNVGYDVSVLGLGMHSAKARTGVFRAVEGLARGLAASPECDLRLVAGDGSLLAVSGVLDYLAETPPLARVPFSPAGIRQRALRAVMAPLAKRAREGSDRRGAVGQAMQRMYARGYRRIASTRHPVPDRALRDLDLLHVPHGVLPARGTSRCARVLTVYDVIGLRFPEWCEPHVPAHVREMLDSIMADDWVIATSEATKRDLCAESNLDPERISVVPLAASPELFHQVTDEQTLRSVRERYRIPAGPYLLSVNTLEPRKNLGVVVEAFGKAVEQAGLDDLHLVLVGASGWKNEALLTAIERLRLAPGRVLLTGYVDDADLAALYSGALAFVSPSLYEGFGLPPLEAMQCGVPVIGSNSSSLPEVIGDAGWTLDPDDPAGFAQAVVELYGNATLRAEMSARSLARAAHFSWERCTRETIEVYRAVLDG